MNQHPIFSEHPGLIIVFAVAVVVMLLLDLGIFNKKSHVVTNKEAITWSLVWISLAMIFSGLIYHFAGAAKFYEFQSAYWIEKALSVDNLFVFILVFKFFDVHNENKHKVLFWGILGALIMRAIFIGAGVALIEKFHWIIYVFGAFLVLTGIKMAINKGVKIDPEKNVVVKFFKKFFPVTNEYHGSKFWIKQGSKWVATPLFIVLILVEFTDLIFAVDSIPAILAITKDPFIVYTSNVFAILGLRSLYFALAGLMHLFTYLHYGLSAILIFVGVKMLLVDIYKIPIEFSLGFILFILGVTVAASLYKAKKDKFENIEDVA